MTNNSNVLSVVSELGLIPLSRIKSYYRIGCQIGLEHRGKIVESAAVPGSITRSESETDGVISKRVSYYVSDTTAAFLNGLERLKRERLVAVYIDERGIRRVCGSVRHPLSLSYVNEDGVISVRLEGKSTDTDGILI